MLGDGCRIFMLEIHLLVRAISVALSSLPETSLSTALISGVRLALRTSGTTF